MKIRKGFVSNSSSSSFICEVSGEQETVYDGLSEVGMVRCNKGHTFYEYYGDKDINTYMEADTFYDNLSNERKDGSINSKISCSKVSFSRVDNK